MSGGSLVVDGKDGLLGLDPRTGDERWHRTSGIDNCDLTDALTGPRTITVLEICGNAASPDTVVELDSATGEERWRFALPRNVTHALPVTAEPASVSLGRGGDGSKDALLVFDPSGQHHHEVPKTAPFGELSIDWNEQGEYQQVAASAGTLVVTADTDTALESELAAIDTTTGEVRWHEPFPYGAPQLAGISGDSVTALSRYGSDDGPVRLVEYGLDDPSSVSDGTLPVGFGDHDEQRVIADGTRVVQFIASTSSGAAAYEVPDSD